MRMYGELLRPWARNRARLMVAEANVRSLKQWRQASKDMGAEVRKKLLETPVQKKIDEMVALQVDLITSLPTEASERVSKLVIEGLSDSTRAAAISKEIARSGEVSAARATLIARTESGRANTVFLEARATEIGSTGYVWRTAHDSDVRPSHKRLDGRVFRWDEPPECDPGHRAHPGSIWNCRCIALPLIPRKFD